MRSFRSRNQRRWLNRFSDRRFFEKRLAEKIEKCTVERCCRNRRVLPMKREQKESCQYLQIGLLAEVSLPEAFFVSFSYAPHAHDTFAVGQTLSGFQDFVCRGKKHRGFPGTLITINPDEVHDGHSGLETGFAYRMLYIPAETIFRSSAADMIKQGLVDDQRVDRDIASLERQVDIRPASIVALGSRSVEYDSLHFRIAGEENCRIAANTG